MQFKMLKIIWLLMPLSSFANELILENANQYEVPKDKIWILKSIQSSDCKVCTSDLMVDGGLAIGDENELTMYGKIEISFNSQSHNSIKLFSGTKFWLGDSRPTIKVIELNK